MKRFHLFLGLIIIASGIMAAPPSANGLILKTPKNSIKVNIIPIIFKTYSAQYERTIFRNFSLCLQAGYNKELRLGTYINRILDTVPDTRLQAARARISLSELSTSGNLYLTPEIRVYLSRKGAPNGFYLAPYYRYSKSNVTATFIYTDSNSTKTDIIFKGSLQNLQPGLMLGYQKSLLKRIVFDFWLGGIQFGESKATFDAYADFKKVDKQGVINFIQDNFKYGTTEVKIDSDEHAQIAYTGNGGGLRFGLCVGFRF